MVLVPQGAGRGRGKGEGSDEANKASGVTTVANGSPARGDIGIESVYARQVPERDRDWERENGIRRREEGTRGRDSAGLAGRERMSKSEMARGQPDQTYTLPTLRPSGSPP